LIFTTNIIQGAKMGLIQYIFSNPPQYDMFIILVATITFSLCFHEFAHGYIAYRLGDNTAAHAGRLTLNPIAHLDPMGSLMMLFIGFGYAKPVSVNPMNLKNPRQDMIKIAFAGPASNLFLCFSGCMAIRILYKNLVVVVYNQGIPHHLDLNLAGNALLIFSIINMMLAIFNLIPIHPLDGGQIFGSILSKRNAELAWKLQTYGPQVLFGIIIFGMFSGFSIIAFIMKPFMYLVFLLSGLPA